jgi:hypothetical protein
MSKRRLMTEQEWLDAAAPDLMLQYLHEYGCMGRVPGMRRRLRLFRCACCRSVWDLLDDERSWRAVEVSERHAEGRASRAELADAHAAAEEPVRAAEEAVRAAAQQPGAVGSLSQPAFVRRSAGATAASWAAASQSGNRVSHIVSVSAAQVRWAAAGAPLGSREALAAREAEERTQTTLLRCIFGDPFHLPAPVAPAVLAWHGAAARRLAEAIYEARRFENLPVLADLLEEAGLTDAALLGHLRGPGPHVLGCHALDAVLGKS